MSGFVTATKRQAKARIALDGPSGSGKTWTGLVTALALANGGPVAVIDSELGSASKYADRFAFDVMELSGNFDPKRYIEGIAQAAQGGYTVVLIDSLTHAWSGKGGVLEIVDAAKARFGGNSHMAWSVGTPAWQGLIDAMVQSPIHVIATIRSKTKWVEQEDSRGKKSYQRAGTEPVARDGIEYEFDVVGDLDLDHNLVISKSRAGGRIDSMYRSPGPEFGQAVLAWLTDGAVDVKGRAKELTALAAHAEGLKPALAKAKITLEDLADAKKWEKAQSIARELGEAARAATVVESGRAAGPDNPQDPPTASAVDGQTTLGAGL